MNDPSTDRVSVLDEEWWATKNMKVGAVCAFFVLLMAGGGGPSDAGAAGYMGFLLGMAVAGYALVGLVKVIYLGSRWCGGLVKSVAVPD